MLLTKQINGSYKVDGINTTDLTINPRSYATFRNCPERFTAVWSVSTFSVSRSHEHNSHASVMFIGLKSRDQLLESCTSPGKAQPQGKLHPSSLPKEKLLAALLCHFWVSPWLTDSVPAERVRASGCHPLGDSSWLYLYLGVESLCLVLG